MPPTKKEIPFDDKCVKGLKTLLEDGLSQEEIAKYYSSNLDFKVSRRTVKRRIDELNESEKL